MPFSDAVRRQLSREAGGFCANPDCRGLTGIFEPGAGGLVGEGAHIVAESPKWARGNSPLTLAQRNLPENGVWLCPSCHTKVDVAFPDSYSVGQLHHWKVEAPKWVEANRGLALRAVSHPTERLQVPRPDMAALQGAKNFLAFHRELAAKLFELSSATSAPFGAGALIPEGIESDIRARASRRVLGRSWMDEWSTTYHCRDAELLGLMNSLIAWTDRLLRPIGEYDPRRVSFSQVDPIGEAIRGYLAAYYALASEISSGESYGLRR